MTLDDQTSSRLAELDPAAGLDVPAHDSPRAEALLRGVLAAPRTPPPSSPARRRAVPRLALGALAATVVVTAVLWGASPGETPAFASWVALPTGVPVGDSEAHASDCRDRVLTVPDLAEVAGDQSLVLAERRGRYTLVVLGGERVFTACLDGPDLGPSAVSVSHSDGFPAPDDGWALLVGGSGPASGSDYVTWFGQVGADVERVVLEPTGGRYAGVPIETTIANGAFAAWWPEDRSPRDLLMTVYRADGTTVGPMPSDEMAERAVGGDS